jgi:hypothetical protein
VTRGRFKASENVMAAFCEVFLFQYFHSDSCNLWRTARLSTTRIDAAGEVAANARQSLWKGGYRRQSGARTGSVARDKACTTGRSRRGASR